MSNRSNNKRTNMMENNSHLTATCRRKGKMNVNDDSDGSTQRLFVEALNENSTETGQSCKNNFCHNIK